MNTSNPNRVRNHVVQEYARLAGTYDTKWSFYVQATARETMARLDLHVHDRILDIGCGTGTLLKQLSTVHPAAQLAGVDPVPEMLTIARRKLPSAIGLYTGWADKLPFATARFDLLVLCNMFHYLDRPANALREMRRVLRPGGRLVITDWCGDYRACRMLDRYQHLRSRAHVKVYRARECMQRVTQAGYTPEAIDQYKINWFWGIMTARFTKTSAISHASRANPIRRIATP